MKGTAKLIATLLLGAVGSLGAQPAVAAPADTVNSYSPAQLQAARNAAAREGFTPTGGVWAQAGAIFMYASKGGERYQLTITSDGKVIPSGALPREHPAYNS